MSLGTKISILAAFVILSACQSSNTLTEVGNTDATGRTRQVIAGPLKPFKDNLFAYRQALEVRDNGNFLRAPYNEVRDINQRDEQPVLKVRAKYIKRLAKTQQYDLTYHSLNGTFDVFAVGKINGGSAVTVIYLHGKDGNRSWGFDDEKFGGNYNRLKNLMVENGGAYFSPDFSDFGEKGTADITELLKQQRSVVPGKLILACGSMGTQICWRIANNSQTASMLDGMVLLGGFPDTKYTISGRKMPIYIAHGSRDKVYSANDMEVMYETLKSKGYPVRMTLFESGNHGTPVRMIDWRQALNWVAGN